MARSAKTGIAFVLGVMFLLWTIYVIIASFDMYEEHDMSAILFCNSLDILVTACLLGYWYVRKTKEDRIDDLASYMRMYRRTSIETVAQRLGMDAKKAEKVLLECISKGVIQGFLDRNTGEFVMEKSIESQREGAKCPNCGGFTNVVTLPGEVMTCQYCETIIPDTHNATQNTAQAQPVHVTPVPAIPPPPRGTRIMICTACREEVPIDSNLCPYCGNRF